MLKQELVYELKAYIKHIRLAQDCLIAYKSLCNSICSHNEQINLAPGFFSIAKQSLINCMCVELAKLYVGSGKEKTIRKLLNQISANCNLFPKYINNTYFWADNQENQPYEEVFSVDIIAEISTAQARIKDLEPIINQLKNRRNTYYAHNDPQYFLSGDQLTTDFPLTFNDVSVLIDFAGKFCNQMLVYLTGEVISYQSMNADDLPNLLNRTVM